MTTILQFKMAISIFSNVNQTWMIYISITLLFMNLEVPPVNSLKISLASKPAPSRLKDLLQREMSGERKDETPILLPCCYDGLSARLIARAGFEATFMTGFGVSGEPKDRHFIFFD